MLSGSIWSRESVSRVVEVYAGCPSSSVESWSCFGDGIGYK